MILDLIAAAFLISTADAPLETALSRVEPPSSIRAAFVVEITDGEAFREVAYDPRIVDLEARWKVLEAEGESTELDRAVDEWGAQDAPDSWLFADDLRASMGSIVEAQEIGAAWQIKFEHVPSDNDGPLDVWAAEHLAGYAMLEPVMSEILRVDYRALAPFETPQGAKVDTYQHSYFLQPNTDLGFTYVTAFKVDVQGSFLGQDFERAYRVRVTNVQFFFATERDQKIYQTQLGSSAKTLMAKSD